MLKNPYQIAIFFAVVALLVKLTFFYLGIQHGPYSDYITFIYMFITLVAVFFGIRSEKINSGKTSFIDDIKAGAKTAAFFAVLVSIITYVYYAKIDSDYFEIKKQETIEAYKESIPAAIKERGKKEVKKDLSNKILGLNAIYTPYSQSNFTLLGLLSLGIINSIVFALLMKKFPGFRQ